MKEVGSLWRRLAWLGWLDQEKVNDSEIYISVIYGIY